MKIKMLEEIVKKIVNAVDFSKEPAAVLKQLRILINEENSREQSRLSDEKESFEGYLEQVKYNDGNVYVLAKNDKGKMVYVAYAVPDWNDVFCQKLISLKDKTKVRIYFRGYLSLKDQYQVYNALPEIDIL